MSIFRNPQVILFSPDVVRLARFYESLGFTETFRVPKEGEPIHVDLVLDDYKIGIASVDSTRDDHDLDPLSHGQRVAVILWTEDTAARQLFVAGNIANHDRIRCCLYVITTV